MGVVIAIDGPAASGKSSVARALARRYQFAYVNSGSFYRAITWALMHASIAADDALAAAKFLEEDHLNFGVREGLSFVECDQRILQAELDFPEVAGNVSKVASLPVVRNFLLSRLRELCESRNIVMEGRDIGSVVFPETPYKFYLDASPEIRAQRRAAQGLEDQIAQRDRLDSSRVAAPLVIADDAQVIDSSHLTIDGVVGEIVGRLRRMQLPPPE